jgi:hypothetical protein
VITADLLRAAGMTMTGVGIDELDHALTTGPPHGRDDAQAAARIEFTAAGAGQPRRPSSPERAAATSVGAAACHACSAGTRRSAWRLANDRLTAARRLAHDRSVSQAESLIIGLRDDQAACRSSAGSVMAAR